MTEFTLTLRGGRAPPGDLGAVLAACAAGDLVDLPAMRPEWRPGVVAHLAALVCVLPRYAGPLGAAKDWRGALDRLLPGAVPGQWSFHPAGTKAQICVADVGPGFLGQGHVAKPAWTASPETWALAAMGGLHRPSTGGGFSSPWDGGAYVLTGDGTLAGEVRVLAQAWSDAFVPGPDASAHFPGWLTPAEDVTIVPVPCLWHQRPVRAQPAGSALGITRQPRVVAMGMLPSMPHAAWRAGPKGVSPFGLSLAKPVGKTLGWTWDPRTHLALLAGQEVIGKPKKGERTGQLLYTVERPVTLDAAGTVLRLYGFGTARGRAEVCHLTLSGEGVTGLRRRPLAKAAADTAAAWLDAVEAAVRDPKLVEAHGGSDVAARVVDLCATPQSGWIEVLRPWAQAVFDGALAAHLAPLRRLKRAEERLACEDRWARALARLTAGG